MFGRATITLGIGPHSSFVCFTFIASVAHLVLNFSLNKNDSR